MILLNYDTYHTSISDQLYKRYPRIINIDDVENIIEHNLNGKKFTLKSVKKDIKESTFNTINDEI